MNPIFAGGIGIAIHRLKPGIGCPWARLLALPRLLTFIEWDPLPILAISGGGGHREQLLDTTLGLGASATPGKPFRIADLLQAIDAPIAQRPTGGTGGG